MTDSEWLDHWMERAPRLDGEALERIVRTLDEQEEADEQAA